MTLLKSKRELFIFLTFTESLQSVQIYEQKRSNIFTIFSFNSEHSCTVVWHWLWMLPKRTSEQVLLAMIWYIFVSLVMVSYIWYIMIYLFVNYLNAHSITALFYFQGRNLNLAATSSDYQVLIGNEKCHITHLTSFLLLCQPDKSDVLHSRNSLKEVKVMIRGIELCSSDWLF